VGFWEEVVVEEGQIEARSGFLCAEARLARDRFALALAGVRTDMPGLGAARGREGVRPLRTGEEKISAWSWGAWISGEERGEESGNWGFEDAPGLVVPLFRRVAVCGVA
jgi:hypothetical protein